MSYSIARLKSDVAAALHGTTLNSIQNFNGLCNRAASDILFRVDAQETKRIVETPPVFNGVWDYAIPVDLKGNRIIDIRPQFRRNPGDIWVQEYNQAFDVQKMGLPSSWQPDFTLNFNTSVKTIRINSPNLTPGVVLNTADTTNGNGTWTTGGTASNLRVDNINFISGAGALMVDLAAGGNPSVGFVENSTMQGIDLSNVVNQAVQFLYTLLPTAANFLSVGFRFGSSAGNYYEVTTSVTQENTTFQDAWDLLAFPWLGATVVGAPNPATITYCRITWTYNGLPQTAVHFNGITSILGRILEMEYYSKYLFRDGFTNAFKETVTADTDVVNLDTETYMIFFNRVMYLACQQKQGLDAMFGDGPFFEKQFEQGIARYMALYKSEVQKPRSTYYKMTNNNYGQYMGRWRFF